VKPISDRASAIISPRRSFVKKGLAFWAGLAAGGCPVLQAAEGAEHSSAASSEPQRTQREPVAVFDSHLHCPGDDGDSGQWYPVTKTFAEFAAYLDRTGVQRGVVNSMRSQDAKTAADFIAGNREVARHMEKYPGRFLGACVVNPNFPQEAAREIEDCRKQLGFVWVGELCNYTVNPYAYTSPNFALVVEQVVKMNVVLHVHTELEEMEYIIQKFPQATIVFAHFGDSHEEEHIFKRIDAVAGSKNCYLDTSGYGHDRVGVLEYAVKSIGPDRILFGSDFSINDPSTVLARIHHAFLTREQTQKILSHNLEALLKKVGA
jgi:predicted TIM-barrel fold metal-dependent hydrolase